MTPHLTQPPGKEERRAIAQRAPAVNQNTAFTHHQNGNQTSSQGDTLQYDVDSRLIRYVNGTWRFQAGYTGEGLIAWKAITSGGITTTTYFLYDGSIPVCELDSNGNVLATNVFGANGLISRPRPEGTREQRLLQV